VAIVSAAVKSVASEHAVSKGGDLIPKIDDATLPISFLA
jgi:hypothetical protein